MRNAQLGLIAAFVVPALVAACDPDPSDPEVVDTTWTEAFDASGAGWLLSVWGPAPGQRFAVGGTPTEGRIEKEQADGSWAPVAVPAGVPLLNWVFGFGSSDVVVVGNDGTILRGDGTTFSQVASPTDQDLWGVWGAAPDDLWAVGGNASPGGVPTILRWDGATWTSVAVPALQKGDVRAFFKVWGSSADDVLIVGHKGVVLRWNGAELVEELVGASDDLISVWGTGPDHVVIVGGRGNALITTWDGATWKTNVPTDARGVPLPGLNGVWMRSDGAFHTVGLYGTLARVDFASLAVETAEVSTPYDFHAVFGTSDDELIAVGGSFRQPAGPFVGIAFQRGMKDDE
ncbi:MAG: hypothetical protein H6745_09345 [Deltaproteobacteria bacterium]|nr:hypothetical protein [Deltaproteobacteria bacterium]